MKAIQVKYLGQTNNLPARRKASIEGGASVTLSNTENNLEVARALADKLEWNDVDLIEGGLDTVDVFCLFNAKSFVRRQSNDVDDLNLLLQFAEAMDLPVMAGHCRTRLAELGS